MSYNKIDEKIRKNSRVLERIAASFARNSEEYEALRLSALAFAYVSLHCDAEFNRYVDELHQPLPDDPKTIN